MKEKIECTSLELPIFEKTFHQRVHMGWQKFLEMESTLRGYIDAKIDSEEIVGYMDSMLSSVFQDVYAEVGFNGEKYDLVLNLEGEWSRLFPLVYFRNHAPEAVFKYWNILVGRQASIEQLAACVIHKYGENVSAREVRVWLNWENETVKVSVYSPEFLPFLKDGKRKGEVYWFCYILLDYALGELVEMKYISELEILENPYKDAWVSLKQLPSLFQEKLSLSAEELRNPTRYCELYTAYQMEPVRDAEEGLRRDVFAGVSCFIPILREFWNGEKRIIDSLHKEGIEIGYFCYPLYGFQGENRGAQILDYRDYVVAQLEETVGGDFFTFIGGASGIYYGYIDFIAWDLNEVMKVAVSIFKKTGIDWVMYHSFRQNVNGVTLFEK